jgi:O-Antigen ligase
MTYLAAGAGALGAGLLLLSRSRATLLAGFALIALAEAALLLGGLAGADLSGVLRSVPGLAALVVALAGCAALAALLVRYPIVLAPLALVAAPLRPPLELGGPGFPLGLATSGGLGRLLPLYAVIVAGALALVWRVLRDEPVPELPRPFAVPAAAFLALAAASVLWAIDSAAARDQLAFFWVPFTALVVVIARAPVDARLPRLLALALIVPAAVYATIGLTQAATGTIFFSSPDLAAGNAYGSLFRVTSLFDDPSHYGLHLVLAIAVLLVALWLERTRLWPAVALLALLGTGLWFSYSQSSAVSLVAVALALAFVAGDTRTRRAAGATVAVIGIAVAAFLTVQVGGETERSLTSERSRLVEDTAVVFTNHPIVGVGVASQPLASREEAGARGSLRRSASHTTPLTVASELGAIGLVAYLALLGGAVYMLAGARARRPVLGLGLAAALLVLFVHSLFYDGFFDNPITWGVFGVGAAASSAAVGRARQATDGVAPVRAPATGEQSPTPVRAGGVRGAPAGS